MARTLLVDGDHLARLIKLCRTINSSSGATLQTLQSKLKTSRRTVFRDLSALQDLGIDVSSTSSGYKIKQGAAACKKIINDYYTKALNKLLSTSLK